jgi:hypothetical protein
MLEITNALLRAVCGPPVTPRRACEAYEALGALAKWWLPTNVLSMAREYDSLDPGLSDPRPPDLPVRPGSCWVVFRTNPEVQLPLLRKAVLLPLRWKSGAHSSRLPPELLSLADHVIESLRAALSPGRRWGLSLADLPGMDEVHLAEGLKLRCDSGWAPLAGGLLVHDMGLPPQRGVWATGAWKHYDLTEINFVEDKLELAKEWKASDFFLPDWQEEVARRWVEENAPDQIRIGRLAAPPEPDPFKTLNHYLARLAAVPPISQGEGPEEEEAFRSCCNYYRIQPDAKVARPFYWSHLLPGILRRCREKYRRVPLSKSFSHLITIVSPSNELAVLAPQVVEAKHCLLLHTVDPKDTVDLKATAEDCRRRLPGVRCEARPFPKGTEMETAIKSAVAQFLRDVPPRDSADVAFDLTPGTKMMSYSLTRAAQPGNSLFCLEVDYLPDRRPNPDSERPELRRV